MRNCLPQIEILFPADRADLRRKSFSVSLRLQAKVPCRQENKCRMLCVNLRDPREKMPHLKLVFLIQHHIVLIPFQLQVLACPLRRRPLKQGPQEDPNKKDPKNFTAGK